MTCRYSPSFQDFPYPRIVGWISTLTCNLNCIHCYPATCEKETKELTTDESKACISEFASIGVKAIFMSGGEPLLKKDLLGLIEHGANEGIMMFLCTNATLLSERRGRQLKEAGLKEVFVGLEGASPGIVDRFSGVKGTLERKIEGIKGSVKAGLSTSIDFVCTAYNSHELEPVIELARGLGVKGFNLKRFVPTGRGAEHKDDLWIEPNQYRNVIENYCRHVLDPKGMVFGAHEPLVTGRLSEIRPKTHYVSTCYVGVWCGITHYGDVLPCPMLPITIGSLREEVFTDVWRDSSVVAHLRNKDLLKGQCGMCELRYNCGGCRATAYALTGDYLEEDINCWKVGKSTNGRPL